VQGFAKAAIERERLQEILSGTADLARLASRSASGSADARDLRGGIETLAIVPEVADLIGSTDALADSALPAVLDGFDRERAADLRAELDAAIAEEPPGTITEGNIIARGYDDELAEIIDRHEEALRWIDTLADREKRKHGITHLTVDRTKTDGYRPPAYWTWIARIREGVSVPVVANGEIWTVADYYRCREESGCEDVMIGRGLIARPDLARQIKASQQGEAIADMTWPEAVALVREYATVLQGWLEDRYVTGRIKQWLNFLRQGFAEAQALWPDARKIRQVAPMLACLEQPVIVADSRAA
jgi:hypothetical protein